MRSSAALAATPSTRAPSAMPPHCAAAGPRDSDRATSAVDAPHPQPDDIDAVLVLAQAVMAMEAEEHHRFGEFERLEDLAEEILDLDPEAALLDERRVEIEHRSGRHRCGCVLARTGGRRVAHYGVVLS